MTDLQETLASIGLFAGLPPDKIETVSRRCSWRRYGPGQQILGHLDDTKDVYFVVQGKMRATVYSLSGKEVTFRDIDAGSVFGEYAAIDGQPRSANIVALTDSLVASLSPDGLWEVLLTYPEVAADMMKLLTRQIRVLSERVFEFSALAVKNRIHAELLRIARDCMAGENRAMISPVPTHADIASRVSTHREAVTRELNELVQSGVLEREKRKLIIKDMARLTKMVQEVRGD